MNPRFDILAARILASEASLEEKVEWQALLTSDPKLEEEFARLCRAREVVQEFGSVALTLNPPPMAIPRQYEERLERSLRNRFSPEVDQVDPERSTCPKTPIEASVYSGKPWLHGVLRSFLAASVTAILIFGAISVWNTKQGHFTPTRSVDSRLAYVVIQQGNGRIRHGQQLLKVGNDSVLERGDELSLDAESQGFAITRRGVISLAGPARIGERELSELAALPGSVTNNETTIHLALFQENIDSAKSKLFFVARGSDPIPLYTPLGATASVTPDFNWRSEPGKFYQLEVSDELLPTQAPWTSSNVIPPVAFHQLRGGRQGTLSSEGLYRVRIMILGEPLSESTYTFRVLRDAKSFQPPSGIEALRYAYALLASNSGQTGDALAALLALPQPLAKSELALRLKLLAFGRVGYREDYESTASQIKLRSDSNL